VTVYVTTELKKSFVTKGYEFGVYFSILLRMKVPFHKIRYLHRTGCEQQLYYVNANTAVFLLFVLVAHSSLLCKLELKIFRRSNTNFVQFFFSTLHLGGPFQCRIDLLLETYPRVCKLNCV